MRHGIAALTLTVSLGFVGLAAAQESGTFFERPFGPATQKTDPDSQESGSWFQRLFGSAPQKAESTKKIEVKSEPARPPVSRNFRALKAKADLDRRQEVCLRLREIGLATNDDDLVRKAELLDQRAWDLFVATTSQARSNPRAAVESDARKGDRK